MGKCNWCEQDAITRVNDNGACIDHLDQAFSRALQPVHAAVRQLLAQRQKEESSG